MDAQRIEHALVSQWAGEDWKDHYPDAPTYLKVVVGDTFETEEGESVQEFVARLIAGAQSSSADTDAEASESGGS